MLSAEVVRHRIEEEGVIAILRAKNPEEMRSLAQALRKGGLSCLEFTMTSPSALDLLRESRRSLEEEVVLGMGTVLDAETAQSAIWAGADYLVSPVVRPDIAQLAHRYNVLYLPGALTPTEILIAVELGCSLVKLFPAHLVGPGYLKDIAGPLPQVRLVPTGGIGVHNAGEFLKAGAAAVAVGSSLTHPPVPESERWEAVTSLARQLREIVREARASQ